MPDYQRGKIYCIRSPHTEQVYIGSTCQKTLAVRMASHRRDFKCWKADNSRGYYTSFKILELGDAYIELVELHPCNSKDELHKREGHIQRITDCVNLHVAGRSGAEWYQDNAEAIKIKVKQYYQENKEIIKIKQKQNYQNNKEAIAAQKKQYYQNNKEVFAAKAKQYRLDNAEAIKAKSDCPCGGRFSYSNKTRHSKTKKHKNYLAANIEPDGSEREMPSVSG